MRLFAPFAVFSFLVFGARVGRGSGAEINFSSSLSAPQFQSAGLQKLSRDQLAVLDSEVQHDSVDASLTTDGKGGATFSGRRAPVQRSRDGIALLTPGEISQLDALVAQRFSVNVSLSTSNPGATATAPIPQPPISPDAWETGPRLPQIHGSVSLTVGGGKGGSFYGGDFSTVYEDPAHHFAVGFEYSEYRGKGLRFAPDLCGPVSPCSRRY